MLSNYLLLALRTLSKNRVYAAINIVGLAIGICACLLLFRLVHYELSFDRHQPNYDRIVQAVTNDFNPEQGGEDFTPGIPIPAMDEMQQKVPQFEHFARVHSMWPTITVPDSPGSKIGRKFATDEEQEAGVFVEPAFFSIFNWTWLSGDASVLSAPNVAVFSKKMAEKCFGSWQLAQGQTVLMDGLVLLTVRGVVDDAPLNSDFPFHVIASYETLKKNPDLYNYNPGWGSTSSNDHAYALLREDSGGQAGQMAAADQVLAQVGQERYAGRLKSRGIKRWHSLLPLAQIHFDDRYGHLGLHKTSTSRLWTLSLIGLLVLVMACFNFINLATAQAAGRAREVGVRKSLGSSRGQLVGQFMGETGLIVLFAIGVGTGLAALLAPLLKRVSDVPDAMPFLGNPMVWAFLAATALLVTLFSGLYPSLVLAGFQPARALKNDITSRTVGGVSLRKVLVVAQFTVAQALIIGTLVTVSQMSHIQSLDLGYKPDLIYTTGVSSDSASVLRFGAFGQQLRQLPGVESVSFSTDVPSSDNNWAGNFAFGRGSDDAPFHTFMKFVDADYFGTYGLRLVAGRALQPSDTTREVVVNQTLLRKLGIANPEEALQKDFRLGGGKWMPVVGVVEDFKANSARDEMKPMVLFSKKEYYSTVGIKVRPDNMAATTAQVQQVYEATFPEQVYEGEFLDERIADFYRDEQRLSALCKGFAVLAVLISCLGLYGLASLVAVQRRKEVGIRKVLGASSASVVGLLSRDFLILVVASFAIAAPVAYWLMNQWLQDFVYRAPLAWWIFAATVTLACAVALLTVGLRAWRAAVANPVVSLRSE